MRPLILLLLLLLPGTAAAGLRVEALTGATFRANALREISEPELEFGLRAGERLHLFGDLPFALTVEGGYSVAGSAQQTRGLSVDRSIHVLQLGANLDVFLLRATSWQITGFLGGGPATIHTGVDYDVVDPVVETRSSESVSSWSPAAVMQLGFTLTQSSWLPLPLLTRVESRSLFRDGVCDQTVFASLGVALPWP